MIVRIDPMRKQSIRMTREPNFVVLNAPHQYNTVGVDWRLRMYRETITSASLFLVLGLELEPISSKIGEFSLILADVWVNRAAVRYMYWTHLSYVKVANQLAV
jgi:hypothetical protein